MFFLGWEEEGLIIEPLEPGTPTPLLQKKQGKIGSKNLPILTPNLAEEHKRAADLIGRVLLRKPRQEEIYHGKISKVADFGVFVEFLPGFEGLVHVSELNHYSEEARNSRMQKLKEGDDILVEVTSVDVRTGRIRLSERSARIRLQEGARPVFERYFQGNLLQLTSGEDEPAE